MTDATRLPDLTAIPAVIVQHGTAPDSTPAKHRPWRAVLNVLLWPVRFVLDKNGNPSTTKLLIVAIVASAWHQTPVEAVTAVALLSASFGYSAWKDYSSRFTATATAASSFAFSSAKSVVDETTRTIAETIETVQKRRDPESGIETTQ